MAARLTRNDFLAVALAGIVATAGAGYAIAEAYRSRLESALLRSDGGDIAADPTLLAHANKIAQPAYAAHCAGCHGPDMRGDRGRGVPDLSNNQWLYGSGEITQIERTILYGIRSGHPKARNLAAMPAYGRAVPYAREKLDPLTPDGIDDVVEHILDLRSRPADADSAARGAALYAGAGGCYDCHAGDAKGDAGIGAPDLTHAPRLWGGDTREDLRDSIANGHAGICPAWDKRLRAAEIRALAVYIFAVSRRLAPAGKS